jgi:hypothetical protein
MFNRPAKLFLWLITFTFVLSSQACAMAETSTMTELPPSPELGSTTAQAPILESPTSLIRSDPVVTLTPVQPFVAASPEVIPVVQITAVKGNLYIRRGPYMAYNPISVLEKGQSATALARDILAHWLQIPLPGQPDKTGWVSVQTDYSSVIGDVMGLPEIMTTDWPVASYLRNCTYHQMIVQPGDTIIPSLYGAPDNEMWIYPGSYTVYDFDLPDQPEVMSVDLREGVAIDIRVDGNGERRKCPE